jgi:hypothetical protein
LPGDDDNYTKLTNIWHSEDFIWPETRPATTPPDAKSIWHVPPSADRKNIRSKTPDGFARAVFMANTGMEDAAKRGRQVAMFD